ncbi:MAG: SIMPL domain-containing protein [Pseudomonadota bacterium]
MPPFAKSAVSRLPHLPLAALALMAATLAAPVPAPAQDAGEPRRTITVQGAGETTAVPDMAHITLGVTTEARSAARALDENSAAMTSVMDALSAAGIESRDIMTASVNLNPVYDQRPDQSGRRAIRGYRASNQVRIRVRALESLGSTLDAVANAGATDIHGISFGLSEPEAAMDAARRDAIADARRRATLYAEAAGAALGPVLTISEVGIARPFPMQSDMMMRAEAAMAVPVSPGEQSIGASITVVYALE